MNIRNIMRCSLITLSVALASKIHAQEQTAVRMTKDIVCAELDRQQTIETLFNGMNGNIEHTFVNSLTSNENKFYLEVGNARIGSAEDLSPKNQLLYTSNPDEFISSVKVVPSFETLEFLTNNQESVRLDWKDSFGWGKMTNRSFEESYILTGTFLEYTKKWARFTPKKTENYYRNQYDRSLVGYSAGEVPFKKITDQVWLFGYAKHSGGGAEDDESLRVSVYAICYFEKYAKSLEIVCSKIIPVDSNTITEEEESTLVKSEVDSLVVKCETLAGKVLLEIQEKELVANPKSLQMLKWDRIRRTLDKDGSKTDEVLLTEDLGIPVYVGEIESLRLTE